MPDKGICRFRTHGAGRNGANIITRLQRNHDFSPDTVEKMCSTLHCGVDDILEFNDTSKEGNRNDRYKFSRLSNGEQPF